jgi:hypothetical protein
VARAGAGLIARARRAVGPERRLRRDDLRSRGGTPIEHERAGAVAKRHRRLQIGRAGLAGRQPQGAELDRDDQRHADPPRNRSVAVARRAARRQPRSEREVARGGRQAEAGRQVVVECRHQMAGGCRDEQRRDVACRHVRLRQRGAGDALRQRRRQAAVQRMAMADVAQARERGRPRHDAPPIDAGAGDRIAPMNGVAAAIDEGQQRRGIGGGHGGVWMLGAQTAQRRHGESLPS